MISSSKQNLQKVQYLKGHNCQLPYKIRAVILTRFMTIAYTQIESESEIHKGVKKHSDTVTVGLCGNYMPSSGY